MTDLPPLSLLALHHTKDGAFDPSETWIAACDAIDQGYPPSHVGLLLAELDEDDFAFLSMWWEDECRLTFNPPNSGRAAECPDLRLAQAISVQAGEDWALPMIDPETVLPLLGERDDLKAENAKLRGLLEAARDTIAEWAVAHVWREDDGEAPTPQHHRFMAEIAKALGE